jgi:hypothetical protein
MTVERYSVALTGQLHELLAEHLLRADRQEDVCLATYRPSTGTERWTAVLCTPILPSDGERLVHGNASFTTAYILRAAAEAVADGCGVAALHSHPMGRGWQPMSVKDAETEAGYANLVRGITKLPLTGLTLASDHQWSARVWNVGAGRTVATSECENVRVVHPDHLKVSWNDSLRPPPPAGREQVRTINCWGEAVQADVTRLRILVVGDGSVGLPVGTALSASGVEVVASMDYDTVKVHNLDRLPEATPLDAFLKRPKAGLARRLVADAATACHPRHQHWELSVCEPDGLSRALDFDVIFSCVDRPWARHVLNTIAYADLIPVIDGGVHADPFPEGGMRGAMWRSHVAGPGRICLACNLQYNPSQVMSERDGSLDNVTYIASLPDGHPLKARQNVSMLSVNCAGGLLAQFISLVVVPSGQGDPGPIRYHLALHWVQHDENRTCIDGCPFPRMTASGDGRPDPTGRHADAENERSLRRQGHRDPLVRAMIALENLLFQVRGWLQRVAAHRM